MTIKNWEKFELNCTDYLNSQFKNRNVLFEKGGSSNSNDSDISIYINHKLAYKLECKLIPAQSSQFVVRIDKKKKKMYFSNKNRSPENFSKEILIHMNEHFNYYSKKNLNGNIYNPLICNKVLINDYVEKNLSYKSNLIIYSKFSENFNQKRPLMAAKPSNLKNLFNIEGVFRNKRSGSRDASCEHIKYFPYDTKFINGNYYVDEFCPVIDDFSVNQITFHLSKKVYIKNYKRIKILSNTNNCNVIFSLNFKDALPEKNNLYEIEKLISNHKD